MEQLRLFELLLLLVLTVTSTQGQNDTDISTEPPKTTTPVCKPRDTCCSCPANNCTQTCPSGFYKETCPRGYRCEKEGLPSLTIPLIAGGVGIVVLLVVIVLIYACVRCRKQKLKTRENVTPIKCGPIQSVEQAMEAGEQPEDDTYLIVLPDENLPCSTGNGSAAPTTDTIYVNVLKEGKTPRIPVKTPPSQLKFSFNEVQKSSEEAVKTDSIYVNVSNESNGVSPRTSNHPSPPQDDDDDNDQYDEEADNDEDTYDYPGVPYTKPKREAKAKTTSPKKLDDEQQTSSLQRGRAPAVPSRDQDIYSPVYEERNMARGVNFPSSPKIGSPCSPCSPKLTTDHVYGNVPLSKGSRSPSAPDIQKMVQQRLSPSGYLPMAGSEGRLTSFQYARDSAEDDELYVNNSQLYVNANPNNFS